MNVHMTGLDKNPDNTFSWKIVINLPKNQYTINHAPK
jgi:hypothetical protein